MFPIFQVQKRNIDLSETIDRFLFFIIILSINKHLLIGQDGYPLKWIGILANHEMFIYRFYFFDISGTEMSYIPVRILHGIPL